MRSFIGKTAVAAAALIAAALAHGASAQPNDYRAADRWLCRPDAPGPCVNQDITATALAGDGSATRIAAAANRDAPIDCFYVYPTVSREPAANADRTATASETIVVRNQFARFGSVCRLFAPLYRQVTLAGLRHTAPAEPDRELPHADIVDAWHDYLAHDNGGRGVVLIGHSQGAAILARLIAEEIDGKPAAPFVGAILIGTHLDVPTGRDVGGSFTNVPLCRKRGQTGCVIAYSTFRTTEPPSARAPFVGDARPGMADACVNPMALDDAKSADAYLPVLGAKSGRSSLDTPFFTVPGLITARCMSARGQSWLAVTLADDRRADAVGRLFDWASGRFPGWGLHVLDPDLFMGNLVDLVAAQGRSWAAQHPR